MNNYGDYISEEWVPLRGAKICSDDMYKALYQLLIENIENLQIEGEFSVVFMKDGNIYEEELKGIKKFIKTMRGEYSVARYVILSVKKNIPYRLYKRENGNFLHPNIGSYAILEEKYGILASTGYPVLKNRLAKPLLIEIIETVPPEWYNIHDALKEAYRLSFMHWASLTQKTKYPAPIKYADDLSYLLSKGVRVSGPPL